ncbi:MAG: LPS export ABC transporter periplasmic protein LptC [Desulfosoma sp.]
MKKSAKVIPWLFMAMAVVLTVFVFQAFFTAPKEKKTEQAPVASTVDADIRLTDMDYTEVQEGKPKWRLKAQEAKYYEGEQKTLLTGVTFTLFLEDQREVLLVSDHGLLYAGRKDIELWGNVTARVPQGYEVHCDKVLYQHGAQNIESRSPVRLTGPQLDLEGRQWHYDLASSTVLVEGNVKALVRGFFGASTGGS